MLMTTYPSPYISSRRDAECNKETPLLLLFILVSFIFLPLIRWPAVSPVLSLRIAVRYTTVASPLFEN